MLLILGSFYSALLFEFLLYLDYTVLVYFVLVIFLWLWTTLDLIWLRILLLPSCYFIYMWHLISHF